jgi:uncharacterized membrane protein
METTKYLNDIKDIKNMMANSSQFLSLSGFSGIMAGVYALIGGFYVHKLIESQPHQVIILESATFKIIILVAMTVLILSVATAFLLTYKKANKAKQKIWSPITRKLLFNFCIPLFTGGLFAVLLLRNGYYGLIAPITLIFYGLACVQASKYTLRDVMYLGICNIILGLLAIEFFGYGLYFWMLGFGVMHIIYGGIMYWKYDRSPVNKVRS